MNVLFEYFSEIFESLPRPIPAVLLVLLVQNRLRTRFRTKIRFFLSFKRNPYPVHYPRFFSELFCKVACPEKLGEVVDHVDFRVFSRVVPIRHHGSGIKGFGFGLQGVGKQRSREAGNAHGVAFQEAARSRPDKTATK